MVFKQIKEEILGFRPLRYLISLVDYQNKRIIHLWRLFTHLRWVSAAKKSPFHFQHGFRPVKWVSAARLGFDRLVGFRPLKLGLDRWRKKIRACVSLTLFASVRLLHFDFTSLNSFRLLVFVLPHLVFYLFTSLHLIVLFTSPRLLLFVYVTLFSLCLLHFV